MFSLLLLLHMDAYFLVIFLTDAVWFEFDTDFSHSVRRDSSSGGHIVEGRAGVGIIDTSSYLYQSEMDLKVAHITDLYHTFRIFIQQNTSHCHQTRVRLDCHLWPYSLPLQLATH